MSKQQSFLNSIEVRCRVPDRGEAITVLISQQHGQWVGQCVEYDIAAQGRSLDDVISGFERTLNVQIAMDIAHGREPLTHLPPAPERFRRAASCDIRQERDDCAALLRRMVNATRPEANVQKFHASRLRERAQDYLRRKGLQGNILRIADTESKPKGEK